MKPEKQINEEIKSLVKKTSLSIQENNDFLDERDGNVSERTDA